MISIIKQNIKHFKQIILLSRSELIKTFKGAALGPIWALVKPTILISVYYFAFEFGIRAGGDVYGHPFILFLMVGIIAWFFMSDAILDGANSLRSKKNIITKLPFPVEIVMTYVNLSKLYIHFILLGVTYIILLFSGYTPSVICGPANTRRISG